ncbi:DNA polymerase alpha subunit B [Cymbomonas tetramitiformis]|uniref:DNA polymerase alpha subunit B n=1 Tax=Cymbomonas tetramitiformis TaxID=36881 RepID=A0AAE0L0L1_9CHLO|nr:DNA polymerase alpha subunit B [Cymbomonas tetramitiformis]
MLLRTLIMLRVLDGIWVLWLDNLTCTLAWGTPSSNGLSSIELPIPMYNFNEARQGDHRCFRSDVLRDIVVDAGGWEYIVEGQPGNPKPGFISSKPGQIITMKVNTRPVINQNSNPTAMMHVSLGYLQSYEHMGRAALSCENCQCEPTDGSGSEIWKGGAGGWVIDAHIELRESTLGMWFMRVSQHAECLIRLETLEDSSSGENKFKITNVMVSELPEEDVDGFYHNSEKEKSYVGVTDDTR